MSRIEENRKVVDTMIKMATDKPNGTFEEMVIMQQGIIASVLADISKSLAAIAQYIQDRREEEE